MNSITSFKESINKEITTTDILKAILSQIGKENIAKKPSNIHEIFFELSLKVKYKKIFEKFYFDTCGIVPFSKELDEVLFRLETSNILKVNNPSYRDYVLTDKKEFLDESYNKFNEADKEIIKEIADEFIKKLDEKKI